MGEGADSHWRARSGGRLGAPLTYPGRVLGQVRGAAAACSAPMPPATAGRGRRRLGRGRGSFGDGARTGPEGTLSQGEGFGEGVDGARPLDGLGFGDLGPATPLVELVDQVVARGCVSGRAHLDLFNSDVYQPPGVASTNSYAAIAWADGRLGDDETRTQDNFGVVAQFSPLPVEEANTGWKTLVAVLGGLVLAGIVLLAIQALRRPG